ncbi:hypothetical protein AV530_017912 [Patagioenas fasciata monilis]|uniref:Mos1 transposase HTH domain-containing protein n=1 Tax=Patagioenas fasciata monilis TaxID=372326 RepID=A0A1V4KZV2_PATFA|nr:hypothetical protein AV530_017912 [Patagioenas fasciata monilis]
MTSLTQRSSGLVQRRTEASRSAAADKERGVGGGPEDEGRRDEPGDDEKGDSKETRLTLMEEVLLLGLKDRETMEIILDKKQIQAFFLLEFKMGHKAVETMHNINNAFIPGTAKECTVQWWFKTFRKGHESLEDEEHSG